MSPLESSVAALADARPSGVLAVDGRQLAWAEYGAPGGRPVFYLGGGDSSRLEGASLDGAARSAGVWIIAPDRPGFGHSDPAPDRTLVQWPTDVAAIADHLGVQRFSVVGLSGGGPHALATAWALPERVTQLVVVASAPVPSLEGQTKDVAFPFRMIATLARRAPWAMRFVLVDQHKMANQAPAALLKRTRGGMGAADAAFLADDRGGPRFAASMRLAYRQGVEGSLHEHQLYRRDWGFPLEAIATPTVFFIGTDDVLASRIVNQKMAAAMPQATFHVVPDEGHLSLIPNHPDTIIAATAPRHIAEAPADDVLDR